MTKIGGDVSGAAAVVEAICSHLLQGPCRPQSRLEGGSWGLGRIQNSIDRAWIEDRIIEESHDGRGQNFIREIPDDNFSVGSEVFDDKYYRDLPAGSDRPDNGPGDV